MSETREPWFDSVNEFTSIPDFTKPVLAEADLWETYHGRAWPVYRDEHGVYLVLGKATSGLTAVEGTAQAMRAWDDTAPAWAVAKGNSVTCLYLHPGGNVRRRSMNRPANSNESVPIPVTVLGDGERAYLPGGGDGPMWTWRHGEQMYLPEAFLRAVERSEVLVPTSLDGVVQSKGLPGQICRPDDLTMIYGPTGTGTTMVMLAQAADVLKGDDDAEVVFLDYDGNGAAEIGQRMRALGQDNLERVTYYEQPAAIQSEADVEALLGPRTTLLELDSISAWAHANGTTDRLGSQIVPLFRLLQRVARRRGIAIVVADESGRGVTPRGASEKLEIVSTAWRVKPVIPFRPGVKGLLCLECVRDRRGGFSDMLVEVHADPLRLEWNSGADPEQLLEAETAKRIVEAVRSHPRTLTRTQLGNRAELGGSRDLRRRVVEELEAEGHLEVVTVSRFEHGTSRKRPVYVATPPEAS